MSSFQNVLPRVIGCRARLTGASCIPQSPLHPPPSFSLSLSLQRDSLEQRPTTILCGSPVSATSLLFRLSGVVCVIGPNHAHLREPNLTYFHAIVDLGFLVEP